MRFYYFLLNSDAPTIQINLAHPQYGIEEAIHGAGFDYVPNSLYIGRTHFHFLSEKELEPNDLLAFNHRLLQNEALSALCARFGGECTDGLYFQLQDELECGALLDNFDTEKSLVTEAQLQLFDLRDIAPLFEDFRFYDGIEEGPFRRAFYAYHQFGLESREFHLAKLDYLGTLPLIDGLCLFPDPSWRFYQVGRYYRIDVAVNDPHRFNRTLCSGFEFYSSETNTDGIYLCTTVTIPNGSCCLHQTPPSDPYDALFAAVGFPPTKAPKAVRQFNPNSAFDSAIVFNVGQALMVGLFEQKDLRGFFDFGLPDSFNKCYLPNYNCIAAATAALIHNSGLLSDIIISHTHRDHINMAFQVPASYSLDWHVPDNSSLRWSQIAARIRQAGGSVTIYTSNTPMPNWGGISIHKIDTPSSSHSHANGIFAELNLSSGNRVLLPGDCILAKVSAAVGPVNYNTYNYLQACHHGGEYFLSSSNLNDIPRPNHNIPPCICYSYSQPNRHHHPSYDAHYRQRGWTNEQRTPSAPPAPTGYIAPMNNLQGFEWT